MECRISQMAYVYWANGKCAVCVGLFAAICLAPANDYFVERNETYHQERSGNTLLNVGFYCCDTVRGDVVVAPNL